MRIGRRLAVASMSDIVINGNGRLGSVRTEVELDWRALGWYFFEASDEEQAEFLLGWIDAAEALGYAREDMQYSYTAEALPDDRRMAVTYHLSMLIAQLDHERYKND